MGRLQQSFNMKLRPPARASAGMPDGNICKLTHTGFFKQESLMRLKSLTRYQELNILTVRARGKADY